MAKKSLGERMKEFYELRFSYSLPRRVPVIIRLDGKAFHTFTKGLDKPFSLLMMNAMMETTRELCKNIQGCSFAYSQSDEISLLITDWEKLETDGWFDYGVQKMCSVSASMATLYFNRNFPEFDTYNEYEEKYWEALFDARVFSMPKEDVLNYFIWRQQDATRNAVQALGQANFSHDELQGKNASDIQEMLFSQRGINFNELRTVYKRGFSVEKIGFDFQGVDGEFNRRIWTINDEIGVFSKDEKFKEYMKQLLE